MAGSDPLRHRWWVVIACLIALIVNGGNVIIFTFAVFLKPVTADLGVGRGMLGGALALATASTAVMLPVVGWLIDRWGVRPILLPGAILFVLATAAMSWLDASPLVLFGLYAIFGLLAATTTPMGYAKAVASWFDRKRGLALGIAMAGVGLGTALVPAISGKFIELYGWRTAWVALAGVVFVLSVPTVAAFVKEPFKADRARNLTVNRLLPGLTVRQAARGTREFWSLTFTFLLVAGAVNGTLAHLIALLTDHGVPPAQAASTLVAAGLSVIVGRVIAGFCLDRFSGPYTAAFFFTLPFVGILLLLSGAGGPVPFLGAILCGLGVGAEVDFMGFFVSRYFGLKAFGQIYSLMFALVAIASGGGPALMGLVFDRTQSYAPMLIAFEVALVVSVILVARLGPYVYTPGTTDETLVVAALSPEGGR